MTFEGNIGLNGGDIDTDFCTLMNFFRTTETVTFASFVPCIVIYRNFGNTCK
jgi:hypothetical protein